MFLASCTSSKEYSQEKIWLLADADNALRTEIFGAWTNYSFILEYTIQAQSSEDYSFIVGQIDGPFEWSQLSRMRSLTNISQEEVDALIAKDLQEPLYEFAHNIGMHLQQIKSNIEDEKRNDIHMQDEQMQEIIGAVKELNPLSSSFLTDSEQSVETLRILENSNKLIENVLNHNE